MTVEVISLGCRLNLSESEDLRRLLGRVSDLGLTLLSLSCEPASPADP